MRQAGDLVLVLDQRRALDQAVGRDHGQALCDQGMDQRGVGDVERDPVASGLARPLGDGACETGEQGGVVIARGEVGEHRHGHQLAHHVGRPVRVLRAEPVEGRDLAGDRHEGRARWLVHVVDRRTHGAGGIAQVVRAHDHRTGAAFRGDGVLQATGAVGDHAVEIDRALPVLGTKTPEIARKGKRIVHGMPR